MFTRKNKAKKANWLTLNEYSAKPKENKNFPWPLFLSTWIN